MKRVINIIFRWVRLLKKEGKYLLLDRMQEPFGFAAPAGHVDEGETPAEALIREVKEETDLDVIKYDPAIEEFNATNACSRGVTGHYWYVFYVEASGEPMMNPEEMKSLGWYSKDQLKELTLEPVWKEWFKKLGVI